MRIIPIAMVSALILRVAPSEAATLPFHAEVEKLENGLRLVMVEYPSPGLLAYYSMVRVGSRDEVEKGVTGFAHFFEHMMFRGTKQYPPEAVDVFLKKAGADQNGFTTDDFTCFTFFGRADFLEELVRIEADRFQNLQYTEDAFKTESKAVLGEYNKSASSPSLPLEERLRELSFKRHTYGHTTLGYLKDIEDMPNQYAYSRKFFERYYTPDNTIVIVVGDFDKAKLRSLVKQQYGAWRTRRASVRVEREPPQGRELRAHIDWNTPTLPLLSLSWRSPATSYASADTAVYSVMHELLLGLISPVYTELVLEKQIVDSIEDWSWNHRDPYLLHVLIKAKSEKSFPEIESRIDRAVADLATGKLDERVLEDVKSRVRYGTLIDLDTPAKIANFIAFAAAPTGEIDGYEKLLRRIEKVTLKDVRRFASKYLGKPNRAVVTLTTKENAR